jgi:hypothetical protein
MIMKQRIVTAAAASVGVAGAALVGAQVLRRSDQRDMDRLWAAVADHSKAQSATFAPTMVEGLPEPARRYFLHAIAPGTPLRFVAQIAMAGEIGLGDKDNPGYQPMRASQIIAPPHGFVWAPIIGSGALAVTGADTYVDGEGWTRFWLAGAIPIARSRPTADYIRSAAARSILEALWVPAALLPQNGVTWERIDERRALAVFEHRGEHFSLTLTIAEDGRPLSVAMPRWTNANPEKTFRWQPAGGVVLETATVGGYTVPVRLEAGNMFGTEAYFPFFKAQVLQIRLR